MPQAGRPVNRSACFADTARAGQCRSAPRWPGLGLILLNAPGPADG